MQPIIGLIVIDMQLCAFDGQITQPINEGDKLLDNVAELIEGCRFHKLPIIFVQTCASSGQPYAKDAHGWEIHPRIEKKTEDEVVYKVQSNAFEDTNLQEVLSKLHVSGLITCGIWSEYCVTSTTLAALALGYETYVASDAHGTVSNNDSEAIERIVKQNDLLKRQNAQVLTVSQLKKILGSQ